MPLQVMVADPRDPIVITSQSLVTALGLDGDTCAAAARAGIRRAQTLDHFRFNAPGNRGAEFASGHPAPLITAGFEGAARLVQLASHALRDLMRKGFDGRQRTKLYISLPESGRGSSGAAFIDDSGHRQSFLQCAQEQAPVEDMSDRVMQLILECAPQSAFASHSICASGHAGFGEALRSAMQDLQSGECDCAVLGAADSLVDERVLWWLRSIGRLKSEGNATGLEPGEAAAFFTVERRKPARQRGAQILSEIVAVASTSEPRTQIDGQTPTGRALAEVFENVATHARTRSVAGAWILTDHNGEVTRAQEFGTFLCGISNTSFGATPVTWYPAQSFGDTGSASAAVATGMVHRAFARAYAPADNAVILSSSDGTVRSAIALAKYLC